MFCENIRYHPADETPQIPNKHRRTFQAWLWLVTHPGAFNPPKSTGPLPTSTSTTSNFQHLPTVTSHPGPQISRFPRPENWILLREFFSRKEWLTIHLYQVSSALFGNFSWHPTMCVSPAPLRYTVRLSEYSWASKKPGNDVVFQGDGPCFPTFPEFLQGFRWLLVVCWGQTRNIFSVCFDGLQRTWELVTQMDNLITQSLDDAWKISILWRISDTKKSQLCYLFKVLKIWVRHDVIPACEAIVLHFLWWYPSSFHLHLG